MSGCRSPSPLLHLGGRRAIRAAQQFRRSRPRCIYVISGNIVIMAVMGGMRSFWGPLIGAAVFVVLQDYISSMTVNWMSFIGLIFVAGGAVLPARHARLHRPAERHMNLLEVRSASKAFGSLVAVNDVSLSVAPGELRAIIGPNGAGKTTFFNLITGFFPPTAGQILLDGKDITQARRHRARRHGHGADLPDHRDLPGADGPREHPHRGRSPPPGCACAPGSAAVRPPRWRDASRRC